MPTPPGAPPTSCVETVSRVRYGEASGQLTARADKGFYTHALVAVCRRMDVRFSITIRQHASLRNLIEAIPETDWTPIPYWMYGSLLDVRRRRCGRDHLQSLSQKYLANDNRTCEKI